MLTVNKENLTMDGFAMVLFKLLQNTSTHRGNPRNPVSRVAFCLCSVTYDILVYTCCKRHGAR